jgi:hypothetical protein
MANNILDLLNKIKKVTTKFNKYDESQFRRGFFSDENSAKALFNILQTNKTKDKTWNIIPTIKSLNEFLKIYVCDDDQITWKNQCTVCGGSSINNPDDYVGDYTTDNPIIKTISIYKAVDDDDKTKESLYLNSPYFDQIPKLKDFGVAKLTPSATNDPLVYTVSNSTGQSLLDVITFNSTGFVFKFSVFTITALKIKNKKSDPVTPSKKNSGDSDNKKNNIIKKDDDNVIPVVKTKPLYFDQDKEETIQTKDCNDFPFTLGCVNTKIGDLNAKLFMGDRKNNTYVKRLQDLLNNSGNFSDSNTNMEITKDIWNEIMNKQVIKESVKKVLKEYINKKK